ncbi:MAG: M28 family peptidase [Chloroflexota bacterium]|nr:M28 family peptidase [Chloroflexota bacterium]
MESLYQPVKPEVEEELLRELSSDEPWALIERFSTLVRESSSEDEREAARYIAARLADLGAPHQVYEPELFLSVPISASLQVDGKPIRAKTPSFSASTASEGVTGEVVYIPSQGPEGVSRLFHFDSEGAVDVRGKIVLSEGYGFPGAVRFFEQQGAIAQIYVNPGENIHWGICTTIWGAPDLDSAARQPRTPVVAINRPDGEALIEQVERGSVTATVHTELKEGWFPCPLVVAEIEGQEEPERFLLVHGHYDSWDVGIGDNAVGDATLLELARILHKNRDELSRSVRIAWWPGHSTGRYAGSTWFADAFALELDANCIAQVNIDSPGCRWATEYYDISWMKEAEDFCVQAIRDATGKEAEGDRPHQAGDYSFNNIGISSFFMLLSTMPKELLEEKGYYPVGGCGGNIAWHTEDDTLEIADRDNLMRDLQVYVASLQRVLNNPVHPFDFRNLAGEFEGTLNRYAESAGDAVDFAPAFAALERLQAELDRLYEVVPTLNGHSVTDPSVRAVNDTILELGRLLIPINYTRNGRFRTEPAVPIPPLPDVAPALELPGTEGHARYVLQTHIRRGVNRVAWTFDRAADIVRRTVQSLPQEVR